MNSATVRSWIEHAPDVCGGDARIRATRYTVQGNNAAVYVRRLADALRLVDRPQQAVELLESFVPLIEEDYADAQRLQARLLNFVAERQLEGNNAAVYVQTLANALSLVKCSQQAALILDTFTCGFALYVITVTCAFVELRRRFSLALARTIGMHLG